jgi:hypothetical protein
VGGQLVTVSSALAIGVAIGVTALSAVLAWWFIPRHAPTFDTGV